MRTNPDRRLLLLDAVIDVLAAKGARGLTFRAVDEEASVPPGTSTNYFGDRDDMLRQAAEHLFTRLAPDPDEVAMRLRDSPDQALEAQLMRDIVRRARHDPAGHLAMYEFRLEAARRPDIRQTLVSHFRSNVEAIVDGHLEGGFPGDRQTAILLYLAMTGLLLELLTVPEVLGVTGQDTDDLVDLVVRAIVPEV